MAKKSRLGQKQCPRCSKWIKGTRSKICPYCSYEFLPKKQAAKPAVEAAPTAIEKPAKNDNMITLEQVKKVAQTVKTLGGLQHVAEVLEVIKESGGVKKFKELAEAMSVTVTDAIPY